MAKKMETQYRGLYRKHGLWVWQGPQVKGVRPKPVHTGLADFVAAVQFVERWKAEAAVVQSRGLPLREVLEEWLAAKRRTGAHRSAVTTETARTAAECFCGFLETHEVTRAGEVDVEGWKEWMLAVGLSRATVLCRLRYVQGLCRWAAEAGEVRENPFARTEFRQRLFRLTAIPTRREVVCDRGLRDALCFGCAADEHLQAVLMLGFFAGLRRNEILRLRPGDLEDVGGEVRWLLVRNEAATEGAMGWAVKDGQPRRVPVAAPLREFLGLYVDRAAQWVVYPEMEEGKYKYRWEWKRRWGTYMESCGVPWVTPHVMRHTFVSLLLSAPPERRPSLLHLERWTGTGQAVLGRTYAHLLDEEGLIDAAS